MPEFQQMFKHIGIWLLCISFQILDDLMETDRLTAHFWCPVPPWGMAFSCNRVQQTKCDIQWQIPTSDWGGGGFLDDKGCSQTGEGGYQALSNFLNCPNFEESFQSVGVGGPSPLRSATDIQIYWRISITVLCATGQWLRWLSNQVCFGPRCMFWLHSQTKLANVQCWKLIGW